MRLSSLLLRDDRLSLFSSSRDWEVINEMIRERLCIPMILTF